MSLSERILAIPLEGTEKQIQWARSLRIQKVAFLTGLGNRAVLRELKPVMIEAEIRAMNAWTPERLGLLATLTVFSACASPSARFWIDSRDQNAIEWLRPAWEGVRQLHLSRPFEP